MLRRDCLLFSAMEDSIAATAAVATAVAFIIYTFYAMCRSSPLYSWTISLDHIKLDRIKLENTKCEEYICCPCTIDAAFQSALAEPFQPVLYLPPHVVCLCSQSPSRQKMQSLCSRMGCAARLPGN